MQRFIDKVIVVTGASAGIGKATALAFAREGATIALVARREDRLHEIAEEIQSQNGHALIFPVDVSDRAGVFAMIDRVVETCGHIDILVNNAGIGLLSPVIDMTPSELQRVMEVNFYGLVWGTQAVLPHMTARRSGQIIQISSVVGKRAVPRMSAYCASKFAVQAFSESLRIEVAPYGIDVIVVCPPRTETEFDSTPMMTRPGHRLKWSSISAEAVASVILRASQKRKREVVISWGGKMLAYASFFAPKLLDILMGRLWALRTAPLDTSK
ncbi:MAG: SDR family oxidoreductase [candidate division Zixibacteria bacterium]|nr:SDR family oxidoreductase [candidate division Zixibacteria bacterium]